MTVLPIRTAAETALAEEFAAAKARLPGGREIAARREAAFRRFEANGLPSRRVEEWKYTDLRALMRDAKPLAMPPASRALQPGAVGDALPGIAAAHHVALLNGVYAGSDVGAADSNVTITELFAWLAANDGFRLDQAVCEPLDLGLALNSAFMTGGAVVQVRKGANVAGPIHLAYRFIGDAPGAMYPRTLIFVEPGAQATFIETYDGPAGLDYQVNGALALVVGEGAKVERIKIGDEGAAALHIATALVSIGAKADYREFTFTTGGAVTRNQLFLRSAGDAAKIRVAGANLLKGRQHVDSTLVIDHAARGCESREVFKSVLDGESRGVFQGKIVVRPQAQKTDGKMMTQALLLSETAEADNKPELEIFADDVQCGHGATSGRLDENLLFYLKARGIPPKEAEALLIQAFVGEAIDGIAHEGVRELLGGRVAAWLGARQ
ncbi:MAG TPA: Fe-S cluster assembly protein SufD [Xanthobacteraceae bacterium]|nr:Fe-S cluster assembly protein SufD [Xanthobacteraceae bacterium]